MVFFCSGLNLSGSSAPFFWNWSGPATRPALRCLVTGQLICANVGDCHLWRTTGQCVQVSVWRILGAYLLEYRESLEWGPGLKGTGITWSQLNANSPEDEAQAKAHSGPGIQGGGWGRLRQASGLLEATVTSLPSWSHKGTVGLVAPGHRAPWPRLDSSQS